MNWIAITTADIAAYQAGALVNAMETAALRTGQSNPVNAAIDAITAQIRSDIKSGGYDVDADETLIPAELLTAAVALVVEYAKPRLMMTLKDDERNLADAARSRLDKIAQGKISPSVPDNPQPSSATVQSGGGSQAVGPAEGKPTRNDYNGL